MRALGIDLGARRVGVAISDSAGAVATGVDTLQRGRERRDDHTRIRALVAEWEAEIVVVGLPLSLDGSAGPAARAVLEEVAQLADMLDVPVVTRDERLSTVTAQDRLREGGMRSRRRSAVIDRTAAAVLLQAWLDDRRELDET